MIPRNALLEMKPYVPGVKKEGAIKLASNENPLGISPKAAKAIADAIGQAYIYPDLHYNELRQALSRKYGLSPERFVVGNGSDDVMLMATGAYLNPGDEVVAYDSTFSVYTFAAQLFAGKISCGPLDDGQIRLDRIAACINAKTRIVFLCNPNNPTGTYFSHADLVQFLKRVPKNVLVALDEAYAEYAEANDFPRALELVEDFPNLLVLHTFSKIYGMAGLRVGFGFGSKPVIAHLNQVRQPFNVNLLGQKAAIAALDDTKFVAQSRQNNRQGKEFLYSEFRRLGLKFYETQSNFILFFLDQDCMTAFEKLMNLGVTVRPAKSFGFDKAIRVTIGTPDQNRVFIDSLKKIL